MNAVHGTMLSLAIVMGGWVCSAQEASIPFGQLERNTQLSARLTAPGDGAASSLSPGAGAPEPSASGFVRVPPATVPKTLSSKFYLLNGLHLGTAVFDVEMTQHCIATHNCREGNPLMPSSQAGALSVSFAFVGYGAFVSYKLKKHRSNLWWISPTAGVAAHSVGIATGFEHQ
jgi:hypothetical protein